MNDWDPRENPLVQRAFRTGFRSGPGSYRLGWWLVALGAIIVLPIALQASVPGVSQDDAVKLIFVGMQILLALIFVIGGFQRMLTSFSKERERGTFDFLHLSTLRSTGIVLGFLMAGQLPGYLAMVLLAPVLAILALVIQFDLGVLVILLFCLVFYILVLSVLFLYLGFWAKKASEFRGAAVIYILLALLFGSIAKEGLVSVGVLPTGWGEILIGVPLISQLHDVGSAGDRLAAPSVSWFGALIPSWCAAVIVFAPLAAILFFSLCASLRHRERPAWSMGRTTLFYGWIAVVMIGAWFGQGTSFGSRLLIFTIVSWVVILKLTVKSCPSRTQTVRDLGRLEGNWPALLRNTQGPPLYRILVLTALFLAGCASIGLDPALGPEVSALSGLTTGFLLVLPLFAAILVHQWVIWRVPSLRVLLVWAHILVIWIPLLVYGVWADALPREFVSLYGGLSPFSPILALAKGTSESPPKLHSFAVQGGYLVLALLAARGCWLGGRSAERASEVMLRGAGPLSAEPESAGEEAAPAV